MGVATTATCKVCGGAIIHARHRRTGGLMVLDAEPAPDGTMALDADGTAASIRRDIFTPQDDGGPYYRFHKPTCERRRKK